MIRLATFSKEGKKSGSVTVPRSLTEVKPSHALLHQVVTGLLSNLRRGTAATKTRGEVRGGGKKPWRQKGTGRARAGSIRSPLWRGGGIVFGPRRTRNYAKRIPFAMRRLAFSQVLAEKIRRGDLIIITEFSLPKPKTRLVEALLSKLPVKEGRILVIVEELKDELKRATHNLPYLVLRTVKSVNVVDLLTADSIVITKKALTALEDKYVPK